MKMYQKLVSNYKKIFPKHVKRVVLNVSETCFFKCQMCSFWKNKTKDIVLDYQIWSTFFNDLSKIKGSDTIVTFTGGEPLIICDIFKWLALSTKHGFVTSLNTNGWLLNEKVIRKIYDSKLTNISFSLDGSCPEVHDKIRGMPGSFERIMRSTKRIKKYFNTKGKEISLYTTCVISALNLNDIINNVNLIQKEKHISGIWLQCISAPFFETEIINDVVTADKTEKYWFHHKKFLHLWPHDKEKIIKIYSELITMKKQGYKIVNSEIQLEMHRNYFINPFLRLKNTVCNVSDDLTIDMMRGSVFHCLRKYRNVQIGDLNKQSIDKIWKSIKAVSLRGKMISCQRPCHEIMNCNIKIETC